MNAIDELRMHRAAPQLLAALQAIVKSLADQDDEGMIEHAQQMIDARAAIAAATEGAAPADPLQANVLKEIQQKLRVMLGSSIELYGDECVIGYQIKTGALHSMIGIMNGAGYPVSLPLFPVTARPAAPLPEPVAQAMEEVTRATAKFPTWPTDPLHAVAVLGEEFGELTKAVLQSVYEPHKSSPDDVRTEAIQTAAMALRFLASLDAYEYQRGEQHEQEAKP